MCVCVYLAFESWQLKWYYIYHHIFIDFSFLFLSLFRCDTTTRHVNSNGFRKKAEAHFSTMWLSSNKTERRERERAKLIGEVDWSNFVICTFRWQCAARSDFLHYMTITTSEEEEKNIQTVFWCARARIWLARHARLIGLRHAHLAALNIK